MIARRTDHDLALLHVPVSGLTPAPWGHDRALQPGQRLLAPAYAEDLPGDPSLTGDTYSARRSGAFIRLQAEIVQTDTVLIDGNSGGPLFTNCGEVIGVVSAGLRNAQRLNFPIAGSDARVFSDATMGGATAIPATTVLPPVETVTLFYSLVDKRTYAVAYNVFSIRRKVAGPLSTFPEGFATTRNVVLEDATQTAQSPTTVRVSVLATDFIDGCTVVRRFTGVWTLVPEQGSWKLGRGQIQQVP